ncbi:MAG: hypothetical protein JWP87_5656 [Labilithrix sp.]|nr:hypothetical protein [Labilithrix sp.]
MVIRARTASLFVLMLAVAAAGSAACAAVLGFEPLVEGTSDGATPSETSTDGGVDAEPFDGGPACTDLGVPARPAVTAADAAADAGDPVHMAVKLFDFGIDKTAAAVGFNLDHACSPDIASSTCATNIDEETFAKYGRDRGDKGIDNSGFGLLAYLTYLGDAFAPVEINKRLAAGEFGYVLRLGNWNGLPEDDDVIVEIFPAIGAWNHPDGGARTPGAKPTFTRDDEWMRDRRFQNVVDASRIKSANAWVTGGRLVASFQTATLPITVPDDKKPLDIALQEAFISGMLVPDGTSWRLDSAIVGGRWRTADMLGQVRTIYIKDTAGLKNVVLCDPGLLFDVYTAVKKEVCDGRDLRSTSRDDAKNLPCDSFSTGLRIDTYAVSAAGPFADLPVLATRCTKDGGIPEGDDCAPASP